MVRRPRRSRVRLGRPRCPARQLRKPPPAPQAGFRVRKGRVSVRYAISKDVIATNLEGEAVLLNLTSGRYYSLDKVATRIWELLGEGKDPEQIKDVLSGEYRVERETL